MKRNNKVRNSSILITGIITFILFGIIISSRSIPSAKYIENNTYAATKLADCLHEDGYSLNEIEDICSKKYDKLIFNVQSDGYKEKLIISVKQSNGEKKEIKELEY